jgi:uncharacterized damage-inducible protein DinB
VEYLQRLFAYDAWANQEEVDSLQKVGTPPVRAVQLLAHIVAAQRLWWSRLHGEAAPVPVWPDWTLEECATQLVEQGRRWRDYLRGLTVADLARTVTYTNSLGEPWSNRVEDILRHVALHGAYHRGQIATHLRAAGLVAAYTDYIHAVRQGLVE